LEYVKTPSRAQKKGEKGKYVASLEREKGKDSARSMRKIKSAECEGVVDKEKKPR